MYPGLVPDDTVHIVTIRADWYLVADVSGGDEYYGRSLLSQPHGVRNCSVPGVSNFSQEIASRSKHVH